MKMKFSTLLLLIWFFLPIELHAQSTEGLLQKVSSALSASQTEQAVASYRQAIKASPEKAEMFYWTQVDKNSDACPKMAEELAVYYNHLRSYDKAYLFYKELLQRKPNDVGYLAACAEMEVCRGKEEEALQIYEKVIGLDADNLAANIFIGNYYYLTAEQEKQQLEKEYKKISTPTRMQYASYKNGLDRVLSTRYGKAKECLQNVIRKFPSTEALKTLNKIQLVEKQINR